MPSRAILAGVEYGISLAARAGDRSTRWPGQPDDPWKIKRGGNGTPFGSQANPPEKNFSNFERPPGSRVLHHEDRVLREFSCKGEQHIVRFRSAGLDDFSRRGWDPGGNFLPGFLVFDRTRPTRSGSQDPQLGKNPGPKTEMGPGWIE